VALKFIIEQTILFKTDFSSVHWEQERVCDSERERREGDFLRPVEYVIGFFK
jgi:hypothetical protein